MADTGGGFTVDIEALKDAGVGLSELLGMLDELAIEDIDCDGRFVGHDALAAAYESFTTRWQVGIDNLTTDGRAIADRLTATAASYLEVEGKISTQLRDAGSGAAGQPPK